MGGLLTVFAEFAKAINILNEMAKSEVVKNFVPHVKRHKYMSFLFLYLIIVLATWWYSLPTILAVPLMVPWACVVGYSLLYNWEAVTTKFKEWYTDMTDIGDTPQGGKYSTDGAEDSSEAPQEPMDGAENSNKIFKPSVSLSTVCRFICVILVVFSFFIADPVPGPVIDPVPDHVTDPVPDHVTDPVPVPVTDPVPDLVTDPVPDPMTDPIPDPVTDPIPDPVTDPVLDPVTDPVTDPVPDPVIDPLPDPMTDPTSSSDHQPLMDHMESNNMNSSHQTDSQEHCETKDCKDAVTVCKKIDLESRDYDIMDHLFRIRYRKNKNDRTLNLVGEMSKSD